MKIVIVGGGTAGWVTALIASSRHLAHEFTIIDSSKIGVVGVGESTTGHFTDVLMNWSTNYGCDQHDFIKETGATLKYAIKHKGWTNNIDDYYIGPIDGTHTTSAIPDCLFNFGLDKLQRNDMLKLSKCGYWIHHELSNFNKFTKQFIDTHHAYHIDAHLAGQYFKKVALKRPNTKHIDSEVINVNLNEQGFVKNLVLADHSVVEGDFFIDCSGFNQVIMKHLPSKWVSFKENLPLNTGMPFHLKYKEGEIPEPYTTAWAQKAGWMWQIPLLDRKGCGYVYDDNFTTPEKAQEEIETILGQEIDPIRIIKFDSGRQESAWIKNCVTIGLSSAFLEPLEATSIHSTIVQANNLFLEYIKPTFDETINEGSMSIYNKRTRKLYDDVKDFLVLHYMGGRDDSEFWKYIKTGATQTEFVKELLAMAKSKTPTFNDFPHYQGAAGWPLYSYVMEGINVLNKDIAGAELDMQFKEGDLYELTQQSYYELQHQWQDATQYCYTYKEFIEYFRGIRK
mgnify:CR=1 FL=1|tara:strand:- start:434 stop:1960 length:1527 start_codon:yes stop_codon:yes gene_type:complete